MDDTPEPGLFFTCKRRQTGDVAELKRPGRNIVKSWLDCLALGFVATSDTVNNDTKKLQLN